MAYHTEEHKKKAVQMGDEKEGEKKELSYTIDYVMWILWAILMWGFLITLAVVHSPSNKPGIHEIIITAYFLGFPVVFGLMYILYLKRR